MLNSPRPPRIMPALLVNGASLSLFRYLAFRCFDSQIFPFTFFARPSIKFLQLAPDSCTATIGGKKGQLLIEKRISRLANRGAFWGERSARPIYPKDPTRQSPIVGR